MTIGTNRGRSRGCPSSYGNIRGRQQIRCLQSRLSVAVRLLASTNLVLKIIQTFVFHCAHIEIARGNDHENIQVVFQAKTYLVPFHRIFQRFHGKTDFRFVCLSGVELDFDLYGRSWL